MGAYTIAGITEVPCEIRQGGLRDAILHSAGANADHGVRRSNADKRRAVMMLLQDREWSRWNDSKIARACAVHHETVARIRSGYLTETQDSPRLVERGGTVYPMKPRQRSAGPEPEPSSPEEPAAPAAPSGAAGNVVVLGSRLKRARDRHASLYQTTPTPFGL